jgi:hypothetical protein
MTVNGRELTSPALARRTALHCTHQWRTRTRLPLRWAESPAISPPVGH